MLALFCLCAIVFGVNSKRRKTLEAIFTVPTRTNLEWARIEALFAAIGCETVEGRGSRFRFVADGTIATFHRPHPAKEAKAYQVEDARAFLTAIGVTP